MKTLYKKNKNGSIQIWTIEKTLSGYVVNYGQLDGKLQRLVTPITKGKQNRTVIEQIELEMNAEISGKRDKGYKSLEDLKIEECTLPQLKGMYSYPGCGIMHMSLEYCLNKFLPEDATDAQGNVKPMLAQPIIKITGGKTTDNWKKVTYPIAVEPKLDGVRCLIFAVNAEEFHGIGIKSLSREGKSYDFGTKSIRNNLTPLFLDNLDVILDGELYVHGMPQNRISGAMRSGKYQPLIHDNMEYHVYDIVDKTLPYKNRKQKLLELFFKYEAFELVAHLSLYSKEAVDKYEEACIEAGYEGIMLKPLNGLYESGKRSYNNLKVKQFLDEEFQIIGYELGKRGIQDLVFICRTKDDKNFRPTATGTTAQKQKYVDSFERDKYVMAEHIDEAFLIQNKMATVKFKFYSEYGVPNHCQVKDIRDYE